MPAVVAISDLHLGEESSSLNPLLSELVPSVLRDREQFRNPPDNPIPWELNRLLHKIALESGGIAELVLLGDIMDLSLASYSDCALQTREFFRRLLTGLSPGALVWVPGNHDHHIWVQVCEEEFIQEPLRNFMLPVDPPCITPPGKRTGAMNWRNQGVRFLLGLLPAHVRNRFWLAYPNYVTYCGGENLLFHHGHFFDQAQSWIGTSLLEAQNLSELELFNSAYLEAVWYGSGQSGRLSEQIENAYEEIRWMVERLGRVLDLITLKKFIKEPLGGNKKGGDRNSHLNAKLVGRIERYLGYIEREREVWYSSYPSEFSLVFGHTHRPFSDGRVGAYQVYNTGGWTADELWPGPENQRSGIFVAVPGRKFEVRQFNINRQIYDFCHNLNHALREAVKTDLGAPG